MEQKHFMDIERAKFGGELSASNVDGFEVGDIIQITEKWDGSNASIRYDIETETLVAFSRKQILNFNNTLNGFYNYVQQLDAKLFANTPNYVIFGEWGNKNKIIYRPECYKRWYVFDIYDVEKQQYLPQDTVKAFAESHGIEYIHVLYEGPFISWDHCRTFMNSPAYGDQQEGCFSSRAKILMSDGTQKPMCEIQVGDVVKSYNETTGEIENKRVINKFNNGLKPINQWKQLNVFPRGNSAAKLLSGKITVTNNHLFYDGNGYSKIEDLDYIYHYGVVFDDFRLQAFLGLICSDGNLSKETFKVSQKTDRINDLIKLFDVFLNKKVSKSISGKGTDMSTISFTKQLTQPIFEEYGLSHNVFDYIKAFRNFNDIGWAYFFLGDGSYDVQHRCSLELSSYTEQEVKIIVELFSKHFGIQPRLYQDKRVKHGSGMSIIMSKSDSEKFIRRISKYVVPSHRYKLSTLDNLEEFIGYPEVQYGLVKRKIFKKVPFSTTKYAKNHVNVGAWDLEIEDNHNYFVSGCLVHNCVVKNQTKLNDPNTRQPFYLKLVNESFSEVMKNREKTVDPEKEAEKAKAQEIVDTIVTKRRVEKELYKMRDEGIVPEQISPSDMRTVAQNLPKRIYEDCLKEEKESVMLAGEWFGKLCGGQAMKFAREIILG